MTLKTVYIRHQLRLLTARSCSTHAPAEWYAQTAQAALVGTDD